MGQIDSQETLAELQAMGVNRVVTDLPTADESESLEGLDQQAQVVEWAITL